MAEQDPNYATFDCYFINGVSTLKFEGNTISGFDADGNEVFNHTYTKIEDVKTDFGAAGFLQDALEGMMENCINLFVSENADGYTAYLEQAVSEN